MNINSIYHTNIPEFLQKGISTASMQRLDRVGMNCGCEYTSFPLFKEIGKYSRLDHSIGVALIVWHFTHDEKQALSGLFHDISTPCFAHVIDFLNGDYETQESTEENTRKMIEDDAEIATLLEGLELKVEDVCDYHLYPIADNDSPRLSSDRLEYTLGNIVNYGINDVKAIQTYYEDLIVGVNEEGNEEIMFQHTEIAKAFTLDMLKCAKIYQCDADRCMMEYLALLIKDAIENKIIDREDLERTEDVIIQKLKAHPIYSEKWDRFCRYCQVEISTEYKEGYRKIMAKKRYIDSYIIGKGRISTLDDEVYREIEAFKHISFDYYVKAF